MRLFQGEFDLFYLRNDSQEKFALGNEMIELIDYVDELDCLFKHIRTNVTSEIMTHLPSKGIVSDIHRPHFL